MGRADIDQHLVTSVLYEVGVNGTLDDLLGLRDALRRIEASLQRYPRWLAIFLAYRGQYRMMQGKLEDALEDYTRAHRLAGVPDTYPSWHVITNGLARCLVDAQRPEEAVTLLERTLAQCDGLPIPPLTRDELEVHLAYAEAHVGRGANAVARARAAVDRIRGRGVRSVPFAALAELAAKVALQANDTEAAWEMAQVMGSICSAAKSSSLIRRYERLIERVGPRSGLFTPALSGTSRVPGEREPHTTLAKGVETELEGCRGDAERADMALRLLIRCSGAGSGFLYLLRDGRAELVARSPGAVVPPGLEERVAAIMFASDKVVETDTCETDVLEAISGSEAKLPFVPYVLTPPQPHLLSVGIAFLAGTGPLHEVPRAVIQGIAQSLGESAGARRAGREHGTKATGDGETRHS